MRCSGYVLLLLTLAGGGTALYAQPTATVPPAAATEQNRPPPPLAPPGVAGQWVWQERYGGTGYWAFIKPPDFSNYHGFHTPGE